MLEIKLMLAYFFVTQGELITYSFYVEKWIGLIFGPSPQSYAMRPLPMGPAENQNGLKLVITSEGRKGKVPDRQQMLL